MGILSLDKRAQVTTLSYSQHCRQSAREDKHAGRCSRAKPSEGMSLQCMPRSLQDSELAGF